MFSLLLAVMGTDSPAMMNNLAVGLKLPFKAFLAMKLKKIPPPPPAPPQPPPPHTHLLSPDIQQYSPRKSCRIPYLKHAVRPPHVAVDSSDRDLTPTQ